MKGPFPPSAHRTHVDRAPRNGRCLIEELTVAENFALPLTLEPSRPTSLGFDAIGALLDSLQIASLGDRLPAQISLGEQQRTAIARALITHPPLAVLDEPTAHQDEASSGLIGAALGNLALRGGSALVATHAPDLLAVADRVVRLRDGRIAAADQ